MGDQLKTSQSILVLPEDRPGTEDSNINSVQFSNFWSEDVGIIPFDFRSVWSEDVELPPKEDYSAWLQVVGGFCLNLSHWGMLNAYGAFQTFYKQHLLRSQSTSSIAWIGSTQSSLLCLSSILAGAYFDAGHLYSLLCTGSILVVAGMLLLSLSSEYWQVFLTQALMMGTGFGCLYTVGPAVISQHFHTNTALALSIASTGSALGGVIHPIAFTQLERIVGFSWSTRVLGFILLTTTLIPIFLMSLKSSPRQAGGVIDRTVFRDVPYLLLSLSLCLGFMGISSALNYIELLALNRGRIDRNTAGYLLLTINLSSVPGRVVMGYLANRFGSDTMQLVCALSCAVLTFSLIAIHRTAGFLVFCVLFGFAAGGFMSLDMASVIQLSADKSRIGTRIGITMMFIGLGVLISSPIAGALVGDREDYLGVIIWCGTLLSAAALSRMIGFLYRIKNS